MSRTASESGKPVAGPLPTAAEYPDVTFTTVPPRRYLTVDGRGSPEAGTEFGDAIQTIYPVAYTLHFALKRGRHVDAKVGTLEGLWSTGAALPGEPVGPDGFPIGAEVSWSAMMPVPDQATDEDVRAAIDEVRDRKRPPAIDRVRVELVSEGLCAEIVHIGSYEAEAPTIARLHEAIAAAGCRPSGRHHEIYLGDPRRAAPDKLRTLIRQPVEACEPAGGPGRGE